MSFEIEISEKDLAASDFMARAYRNLLREAFKAKKEKGISQQNVAELLEVNKAVISRALSGRSNLTLRTIGEICWALGLKPDLVVHDLNVSGNNAAVFVPSNMKPANHTNNNWALDSATSTPTNSTYTSQDAVNEQR